MIYRNDDNTIVLQFGTGDIEVGNGRVISNNKDEMYPCCIFAEKPPGKIGERCCKPEEVDDPAEPRPDACINFVFTDVRSIDVVIDHLKQAKERFKLNGTKILSMQEITDEV